MSAAAGCLAAAEVLTPLMLFCWLCCWGDDDDSGQGETSSTGPPKQTVVVAYGAGSPSRRRSDARRAASSCVSLHLPSASAAYHPPLAAHRSDEALARRGARGPRGLGCGGCGGEGAGGADSEGGEVGGDGRYHSAPSVIEEVLARRTWCRSQEIRRESIPLATESPPRAVSEDSHISCEPTSSAEPRHHHDNNKELRSADVKDEDATETVHLDNEAEDKVRLTIMKGVKQNVNESLRSRIGLVKVVEYVTSDVEDRSGATHRVQAPSPDGRGMGDRPPSVEPVNYSAGSCYLAGAAGVAGPAGAGAGGARHASDGDILAPARRPQSGAFSESEVIESVGRDVVASSPRRKETAI